jgi:large subunit ribosomal protein L23
MAIFSKKSEEETPVADQAVQTNEAQAPIAVIGVAKNRLAVIIPRLSEKTTNMEKFGKYVFRVEGKSNKVELRKALEKTYGVKIDKINIVTVKSRARRYGRSSGRIGGFKKAIVTLKPDSKKIEIAEAV